MYCLFHQKKDGTALKFKQLAICKNGGLKFEDDFPFGMARIFRGEL